MLLTPLLQPLLLRMGQPPVSPLQWAPRALQPRLQISRAEEPRLADFAVQGSPTIVDAAGDAANASKPVLFYLPGIELTGYSLHRQVSELSVDYDVRWLAVPTDDRSDFDALADIVTSAIEGEHRPTYLAGESFGGVLALAVALRDGKPPSNLAGLVLINPATSVTRSWPAQLPALLDALAALPAGLSDAAYLAIATPIFAAISVRRRELFLSSASSGLPPPPL